MPCFETHAVPRKRNRLTAPALAICIAGLLSVAPGLSAHAAEPVVPAEPAATLKIAPNLSHFTLENGLEVVVIPDHRAPVVTHMIWYKAGSADEPEGQSGVAHFLEHLMFKGTAKHPDGAFSKMVAELGGQENAFTTTDYTAYFQRVAKEHLPLMMEMEADRMENLLLTDDMIGAERDVVLEERRMRVDSEPASKLRETMNATLFVNHPYGSPVIGWEHEIQALNRKAVIAFYDRFYTPNNAVLVVAGDVTADEVRKLAEETYGKVARRAEPGARIRPAEPPLTGERTVSVSDARVRQESLSQTWIVPSQTTGKGRVSVSFDVLSYILGGGPTSRLYKSAVLGSKIAINAGSYYQGDALDQGKFGFYGTPATGHSLDELETLFTEELHKLIKDGVTQDELNRAKHSMVADAIYAQDSQMSLARIFGSALTTGQTLENVQTWPQQVQDVTAQDVQDAARTYLSGSPVTGLLKHAEPVKETRTGTAGSADAKGKS